MKSKQENLHKLRAYPHGIVVAYTEYYVGLRRNVVLLNTHILEYWRVTELVKNVECNIDQNESA